MALRATLRKKGDVLGALEKEILHSLWDMKEGTVRDVLGAFGRKRKIAYTTVMTVMGRMVGKGYLCRQELGNGRFLYMPRQNKEEFYAMTSRVLFSQMIRNFGSVAVAQFVDALEEVDPRQLQTLRKRLRDLK